MPITIEGVEHAGIVLSYSIMIAQVFFDQWTRRSRRCGCEEVTSGINSKWNPGASLPGFRPAYHPSDTWSSTFI